MKEVYLREPTIPAKKAQTPKTLTLATYNLWNGRVGMSMYEFIAGHPEVDIWCFQEVNSNLTHTIDDDMAMSDMFEELRRRLPNFLAMHAPVIHYSPDTYGGSFSTQYGISMFARISLPMVEYSQILLNGHFHERIFLPGSNEDHIRTLQKMSFIWPDTGKRLNVINYHGVWHKAPPGKSAKMDTPERLRISKRIRGIIEDCDGDVVLAGDFNLDPNTESIKIIRGDDLQDLIADNNITSTRSNLYTKPEFPFADYMFVSRSLHVNSFEVPNVEYSDHLPLICTLALEANSA
jgi:endonuclease/exonuclease/phosphatase family metal-dependent hydrolase